MTTLITGGGSQIGTALAKILKSVDRPVVFASRSGLVPEGFERIKFDWKDSSTFTNPFQLSSAHFTSAYIIFPPPDSVDPSATIIPFVDLAAQNGVAAVIAEIIGRELKHKVAIEEELIQHYVSSGVAKEVAQFLVGTEQAVEAGSEEMLPTLSNKYVGKVTVKEWLEKNKEVFISHRPCDLSTYENIFIQILNEFI
ncbi:hypothetical protein FA15DRAFT_756497 [Coprinopsis marcescibilis]|uniref:NAD(P)-binding protein n=1 Tax=Coprinopsis marcescibilis TaxID=230819 RepID=A0A5C3KXG8_COPMA|nr:hypothetical protein FA15DRAFT_756497 [Coprinopsis marcescibilis]